MTLPDPISLLADWPQRWRHPELWRIASQSAPHERQAVVQAVLDYVSRPREPVEVFRALVNQGSFKAAEALLDYPPFIEAIGDALIEADEGSELDLDHRRLLARGEILGAIDALLTRNRRADSPLQEEDPRFAEALEWSSRDMATARRILDDLEETIARAERERVEVLQAKLAERVARGGEDTPAGWGEAIERSLRRRQLDIAQALLAETPSRQADHGCQPLPDPLENARFGHFAPAQLCRWILGKEMSPPDFVRWNVLAIDASNRSFIEAIERICGDEISEADVTRFVAELESRLCVKEPPAVVERHADAFRALLRGLEDEACPVFAEAAVPLFVPLNGAVSGVAADGAPLVVVFDTTGHARPSSSYAMLTAWDIVRCLARPTDFRFNLLRIIASQLSRHRLIPLRGRSPRNWMLSARARDARVVAERSARTPQFVSGAVGIGKTALLRCFLTTLGSEGWSCRFVNDSSQLEAAYERRASEPAPGYALAVDNGHELEPAALIRLVVKAGATTSGTRLVIGGSPALLRRVPISVPDEAHYRVPLVGFAALRSFAERVFDLNGHPASDVVLDRVAFYAAGRPALLYALLYALFLELGRRAVISGAPVSLDHVETAYGLREYRTAARSILITPIEAEPRANVVLAAILIVVEIELDRSRSAGVEIDQVVHWLEMESVSMSAAERSDAIEYLQELELVAIDDSGSLVALSTTGGGYTLMSLLPNRLQYFSDAKARLRGEQ